MAERTIQTENAGMLLVVSENPKSRSLTGGPFVILESTLTYAAEATGAAQHILPLLPSQITTYEAPPAVLAALEAGDAAEAEARALTGGHPDPETAALFFIIKMTTGQYMIADEPMLLAWAEAQDAPARPAPTQHAAQGADLSAASFVQRRAQERQIAGRTFGAPATPRQLKPMIEAALARYRAHALVAFKPEINVTPLAAEAPRPTFNFNFGAPAQASQEGAGDAQAREVSPSALVPSATQRASQAPQAGAQAKTPNTAPNATRSDATRSDAERRQAARV